MRPTSTSIHSKEPAYHSGPITPITLPQSNTKTLCLLYEAAYAGLKGMRLGHYAGLTSRELTELENFDPRVETTIGAARAQADIDACKALYHNAVVERNPKSALAFLRHRCGWRKTEREVHQPRPSVSLSASCP